jgi:serine/threonine protein kinase
MLDQLIGQVLDNKYRIDKKLGQGGMGAVYLAVHLGTARPVAVKIIVPQHMANEEFIARFQREAKAAGLLRHPNIVNVTDFGFATAGDGRVAYLVMEYLDGCPLSDILKEEKELPLNWVIDILEQICLAIDKAHGYGIIHRDLKPDNIWLEPNERGGYRVKVLDFGLAKVVDAAK